MSRIQEIDELRDHLVGEATIPPALVTTQRSPKPEDNQSPTLSTNANEVPVVGSSLTAPDSPLRPDGYSAGSSSHCHDDRTDPERRGNATRAGPFVKHLNRTNASHGTGVFMIESMCPIQGSAAWLESSRSFVGVHPGHRIPGRTGDRSPLRRAGNGLGARRHDSGVSPRMSFTKAVRVGELPRALTMRMLCASGERKLASVTPIVAARSEASGSSSNTCISSGARFPVACHLRRLPTADR